MIFGTLPDGRPVEAFELAGPGGITARILARGATLASLRTPDREGRVAEITLGHAQLAPYLATRGYLGATIGRFGNRIAGGRFVVAGCAQQISGANPHALHGGSDGFDLRLWDCLDRGPDFVTLGLESPEGDQGFPGACSVQVSYRLEAAAEGIGQLRIDWQARVTAPCPVNLTNHAFFNLGGGLEDPAQFRPIEDHVLQVAASRFLPVDAAGIPLGDPVPVAGTPFDFRAGARLGSGMRSDDPQILARGGYDHCLCLDGEGLREVARLSAPRSGRVMRLATDQPGLQVYSGNFLDGRIAGRGGVAWRAGDALCLEAQGWPDAPNRPDYPSSLLQPGETYHRVLLLGFGTA